MLLYSLGNYSAHKAHRTSKVKLLTQKRRLPLYFLVRDLDSFALISFVRHKFLQLNQRLLKASSNKIPQGKTKTETAWWQQWWQDWFPSWWKNVFNFIFQSSNTHWRKTCLSNRHRITWAVRTNNFYSYTLACWKRLEHPTIPISILLLVWYSPMIKSPSIFSSLINHLTFKAF